MFARSRGFLSVRDDLQLKVGAWGRSAEAVDAVAQAGFLDRHNTGAHKSQLL